MAIVADTFTISVIMLCIVGAVCFYMFTRLKQLEKKVGLMEGILLDLKTAAQEGFLGGFAPAPASADADEGDNKDADEFFPSFPERDLADEMPMSSEDIGEVVNEIVAPTKKVDLSSIPKFDDAVEEVQVNKVSPAADDLELLSMGELLAMAKERGIAGTSKMRKGQLIAALKVEPSAEAEVDGINASSSLINSSSLMSAPL
jgi:hypothetical protein